MSNHPQKRLMRVGPANDVPEPFRNPFDKVLQRVANIEMKLGGLKIWKTRDLNITTIVSEGSTIVQKHHIVFFSKG